MRSPHLSHWYRRTIRLFFTSSIEVVSRRGLAQAGQCVGAGRGWREGSGMPVYALEKRNRLLTPLSSPGVIPAAVARAISATGLCESRSRLAEPYAWRHRVQAHEEVVRLPRAVVWLVLQGVLQGKWFVRNGVAWGAAPFQRKEAGAQGGVLITDCYRGPRGDDRSLSCLVSDIWSILTTSEKLMNFSGANVPPVNTFAFTARSSRNDYLDLPQRWRLTQIRPLPNST